MQKTFRLFVSSTFNDFNEERILLQTKVFPEIKKFCLENKLNFQPIDLRWGVSNEAELDQKTLDLCLNEVRSSKINPHPNFLIMAGDRYGWVSLPNLIEQSEFNKIVKYFKDRGALYHVNGIQSFHAIKKLNEWYKLDLNQIPASYVLNERKNKYINYSFWEKEENLLRIVLQDATKELYPKIVDKKLKEKYFTSATEAEVIEGIFKYLDKTPSQNELLNKDETLEQKDYEHVYAYIRNIDSIDNLKDKFKDVNPDDVKRFKKTLKESIKKENLYEVNVNLKEVDQDEKNYSLNYKYQELDSFEDKILNYLKNSINAYLENIEDITPQELEAYEQNRFKNDKLKDFLPGSRDEALKTIDNYINSNETQALVVYGKSGLGKSSLMAKAIEDTQSKYTTKKTIYRFAGSTANLSTSVEILISILNELGIKEEIRKVQNPQTLQEEPEKIEEFYYRIHDHFKSLEKEIVIFLDAIDQVNNEDNFLWLPIELPSNVKFIISALDDDNYEEDSKYFESLKTKSNNLYQLQQFDTNRSKELVNSMLKKYDRTIQPKQMDYLLKQEDSTSPLYLSVAVQELRHWKSTDKTIEEDENGQDLAPTQKEIIQEFISNLSQFYHHDKEFVKRVFSYLYLTQGLSESELLEVLNTDEEFIKEIAPDTYHNNLTNELPIVIWSRLHIQIKEFLKLEQKDNKETMSFFHREFNEVIKEQEDIKQTHEHLIELLQKLILEYQDTKFDSNRWGKLYIEVVKDYHLEYEFDWLIDENSKLKEYSIFLSEINSNKLKLFYILIEYFGINAENRNNIKLANCFFKFNYYFTKKIFDIKNIDWSLNYIYTSINLSFLLSDFDKNCTISLLLSSIDICTEIFKNEPSKYADEYIKIIKNISSIFIKCELFKETIQLINSLLNKLGGIDFSETSLIFTHIGLYQNLSYSLKQLSYFEESFVFEEKTLDLLELLYFENRNNNKILTSYINSLINLADSLKTNNKFSEALKYEQKALVLLEPLFDENPEKHLLPYSIILNNLGISLYKTNEIEESLKSLKESVKLKKLLYLKEPLVWCLDYLKTLKNLNLITANEIEEIVVIENVVFKKEPGKHIENYLYDLYLLSENCTKKNLFYTPVINYLDELINIIMPMYKENPEYWYIFYGKAKGLKNNLIIKRLFQTLNIKNLFKSFFK